MTDINTTTPAELHLAASADYATAVASQNEAEAELAEAVKAQEHLLEAASNGESVGTAAVRAAQDVVRDKEAAVMLSRAVAAGKQKRMHAAEIPHLEVLATAATTEMTAAAQAFLLESESIDAEIVRLRDRLAVREDLYQAVNRAIFKAEAHNNVVANHNNSILAQQHPSIHPKCRLPLRTATTPMMPAVNINVTQKTLSFGHIMEEMVAKQTLSGMVRSTFGAILPIPTTSMGV
jgi:hypothetical protein